MTKDLSSSDKRVIEIELEHRCRSQEVGRRAANHELYRALVAAEKDAEEWKADSRGRLQATNDAISKMHAAEARLARLAVAP